MARRTRRKSSLSRKTASGSWTRTSERAESIQGDGSGRRESRIEQRVNLGVLEPRLAADHGYVRIRVQTRRRDMDLHVPCVGLAGAPLELAMDGRRDVDRDQIVLAARPGHGEDFAVQVLALGLRPALGGQVVLDADAAVGLDGHGKK